MKRCDSFHWHLQYSHNRFEGSCGNFAKEGPGKAQENPIIVNGYCSICSKDNNNLKKNDHGLDVSRIIII